MYINNKNSIDRSLFLKVTFVLLFIIGCKSGESQVNLTTEPNTPSTFVGEEGSVTLSTLMDEMVSVESDVCFPMPFY